MIIKYLEAITIPKENLDALIGCRATTFISSMDY
jgi:hypothetical protein